MARNDELIDDIFADVVEDVKHEEIKVEQANDPFDNEIFVTGFKYGTNDWVRWLKRYFSLFPGITRYRIENKTDLSDEEFSNIAKNNKSLNMFRLSYIIWFDMIADSVLEIHALLKVLSERIKSCVFNGRIYDEFEKECENYYRRRDLISNLHPNLLNKQQYAHRCSIVDKIECEYMNYGRWALDSIMVNEYGTYVEHSYESDLFFGFRINPHSENLYFMTEYRYSADTLRQQHGRYDYIGHKTTHNEMRKMSFGYPNVFKDIALIERGMITFRKISKDSPYALLVILELQNTATCYMKEWAIFQIPGEDLSVLRDILIGPKEQIDRIIYEAGKKLSTVEIDIRTDAHADDADTSGLNMISYTKPLYAYAGRYVGNRFIR